MSRFSCAFLLLLALSTASAQTRYLISTIAGSNPLGDGGPAAQGLLWNPLDVAADANGNIYIADTDNNLIRRISGGVITTYACNGQPGHSGDGGPALQAECYNPAGIAVDSAGNLYFSDSFNNCVRRVSSDGVISNYAGNGELGYGGDGGPASFASLNQPRGLAVDKSGNLHVADSYNRRIRRVRPTGIIDTVAGTGTMGATGDGGPAVKATFMMPVAVAVDVSGNILAADGYYNGRVRRFSPGGNITTFAGGGPLTDPLTYTGFAASVTLWYPQGLAVDGKGSVYIALGNSTVVVVNSGIVGFFAGVIGTSGAYGGDDASATMAYFNNPHGLAADAAGNLYIADSANHRIRLVATNAIVTTLAGYGHFAGDFGPATSAVLSSPSFLALESNGNLYITDEGNRRVRVISTNGNIGTGAMSWNHYAGGVAVNSHGDLFFGVDDQGIFKFPANQVSSLLPYASHPRGMAFDSKDNLYVADVLDNSIKRIAPDGTVTKIIGNGKAQSTGDGGLASAAGTYEPLDVKVAADGTVYFTEPYDGRIRTISPAGIVNTLPVWLGSVYAIALDGQGNLLAGNYDRIVSIAPSGTYKTIAGAGVYGFGGDGGDALNAKMTRPMGIAVDSKGNIYFSDSENSRIRKLTPDSVASIASVGGDQQTGPAGTALAIPLTVQVNGTTGVPFGGVTVTFAITAGKGQLSTSKTQTGPDGKAGILLTPTSPGDLTITATTGILPAVTFHATAIDPSASIAILGGNNQTALTGVLLPSVLAVTVVDANKKPVAGELVTFAVTSGSASLNPTVATTRSDGSAFTAVTLGAIAGTVTITATVSNLPPVTFTETAAGANTPAIFPGGVVSAGLSTPPLQFAAPNAIVSLFGKNFAPAGTSRAVTGQDLVNGAIPTSLAATCVVFGTTRAPMFLVTPTQINVQVPTLTAPATVNVQVLVNCDTANQTASNTASVLLQAAAPEFFYAQNNPNGRNPVAANDSVTGAAVGDPADLGAGFALAYPGESITLYCTGLGLSTPGFNAGELPPAGAPVPNLSVTIDDVALDASAILYAGIAPMNAGLYQINIVLPANLNTGDHTIGLAVKNAKSPGGAFLSVR